MDWIDDFFGGIGDFFGGGFSFDFLGGLGDIFSGGDFFGGITSGIGEIFSGVSDFLGFGSSDQNLPGFAGVGGSDQLAGLINGTANGKSNSGINGTQLLFGAAQGAYDYYQKDKERDNRLDQIRENGLIQRELLNQKEGLRREETQTNFGNLARTNSPGYSFGGKPAALQTAAPVNTAQQQVIRQAAQEMPVVARKKFSEQVNQNPLTAGKQYI